MTQETSDCQLSREEKIILLRAEMNSQQRFANELLEQATIAQHRADRARRGLMDILRSGEA